MAHTFIPDYAMYSDEAAGVAASFDDVPELGELVAHETMFTSDTMYCDEPGDGTLIPCG